METIIVTNQPELDVISNDFTGIIKITGDVLSIIEKYPNATIDVCENAQVINIYGNAQSLSMFGTCQVVNVYGKFPICNVGENSQLVNLYGECVELSVSENGNLVNNKS